MHVLGQFRQTGDGTDQVITKTDWMRRGKTQTFQPIDRADGFQQLHEGALLAAAVHDRAVASDRGYRQEFVAAIKIHDLAKKSHFLHSVRDESTNFGDDLSNGAAAFRPACARHDTEGAMHI